MAMATGLHSLATLLFNGPIRALLFQINRGSIKIKAHNENYEALRA